MNPCPVCATQIEESFGLIECPKCHSILFVDFDGSLKVQTAEEVQDIEEVLDPGSSEQDVPAPTEDWATPQNPQEDAQPLEEIEAPLNEFNQEIQSFADSEKSNLKEGALFYDVTIYNVDTQELRDEIMDVLKDRKFNVDLSKINFKLPQLTIQDLNAVKASVLVTKLKHLPVDIEWTQTSILQDGEKS